MQFVASPRPDSYWASLGDPLFAAQKEGGKWVEISSVFAGSLAEGPALAGHIPAGSRAGDPAETGRIRFIW